MSCRAQLTKLDILGHCAECFYTFRLFKLGTVLENLSLLLFSLARMKMAASQRSLHTFALHWSNPWEPRAKCKAGTSTNSGRNSRRAKKRYVCACVCWDARPRSKPCNIQLAWGGRENASKGNEQLFHWSSQDESDLTCMIRFSFITWG